VLARRRRGRIQPRVFEIQHSLLRPSPISTVSPSSVLCLLSHRKPSNRQTIFSPPSSFVTRIEHRGLSDSPYGGFIRRGLPAVGGAESSIGYQSNRQFLPGKPLFCTMSAEPTHNSCRKRYLQPSGMLENYLCRSTFYLF
jgi:hypothetical protein